MYIKYLKKKNNNLLDSKHNYKTKREKKITSLNKKNVVGQVGTGAPSPFFYKKNLFHIKKSCIYEYLLYRELSQSLFNCCFTTLGVGVNLSYFDLYKGNELKKPHLSWFEQYSVADKRLLNFGVEADKGQISLGITSLAPTTTTSTLISTRAYQKMKLQQPDFTILHKSIFQKPLFFEKEKEKEYNSFFPYRKTFLCYWLLPLLGFSFFINRNQSFDKTRSNLNQTEIFITPKLIPEKKTAEITKSHDIISVNIAPWVEIPTTNYKSDPFYKKVNYIGCDNVLGLVSKEQSLPSVEKQGLTSEGEGLVAYNSTWEKLNKFFEKSITIDTETRVHELCSLYLRNLKETIVNLNEKNSIELNSKKLIDLDVKSNTIIKRSQKKTFTKLYFATRQIKTPLSFNFAKSNNNIEFYSLSQENDKYNKIFNKIVGLENQKNIINKFEIASLRSKNLFLNNYREHFIKSRAYFMSPFCFENTIFKNFYDIQNKISKKEKNNTILSFIKSRYLLDNFIKKQLLQNKSVSFLSKIDDLVPRFFSLAENLKVADINKKYYLSFTKQKGLQKQFNNKSLEKKSLLTFQDFEKLWVLFNNSSLKGNSNISTIKYKKGNKKLTKDKLYKILLKSLIKTFNDYKSETIQKSKKTSYLKIFLKTKLPIVTLNQHLLMGSKFNIVFTSWYDKDFCNGDGVPIYSPISKPCFKVPPTLLVENDSKNLIWKNPIGLRQLEQESLPLSYEVATTTSNFKLDNTEKQWTSTLIDTYANKKNILEKSEKGINSNILLYNNKNLNYFNYDEFIDKKKIKTLTFVKGKDKLNLDKKKKYNLIKKIFYEKQNNNDLNNFYYFIKKHTLKIKQLLLINCLKNTNKFQRVKAFYLEDKKSNSIFNPRIFYKTEKEKFSVNIRRIKSKKDWMFMMNFLNKNCENKNQVNSLLLPLNPLVKKYISINNQKQKERKNNYYISTIKTPRHNMKKIEKILRAFFSIKQPLSNKQKSIPDTKKWIQKRSFHSQIKRVLGKQLFNYKKIVSYQNGKILQKKEKGFTMITPRFLINNRSFILNKNININNIVNSISNDQKFENYNMLINLLDFKKEQKIEIQRKYIQKKRRRKKIKKETRRRKKRKRFYPRPIWLRYNDAIRMIKIRTKALLIKKENSASFFVNKATKQKANLLKPTLGFYQEQKQLKNSFYKKYNYLKEKTSLSKQNKTHFAGIYFGKLGQGFIPLPKKKLESESEATLNDFTQIQDFNNSNFNGVLGQLEEFGQEPLTLGVSKHNFTISRAILGELKRLLWKSYWLRSNLTPYLKKVKMYLAKIKEGSKKTELLSNMTSTINKLSPKIQNLYNKRINLNINKWENSLYFAEYNRITYLRVQEFISQIRENIIMLEEDFLYPDFEVGLKISSDSLPIGHEVSYFNRNDSQKLEKNKGLLQTKEDFKKRNDKKVQKNRFIKIRTPHVNHSKMQDIKREDVISSFGGKKTTDFWVNIGKYIMAENRAYLKQSLFKENKEWFIFTSNDYFKQPTIAKLRILWGLSKSTVSTINTDLSTSDSLTGKENNKTNLNFNSLLYKRKKLWLEAGKMREQVKYNKTKKIYRGILKKFDLILNEQYEITTKNNLGISFIEKRLPDNFETIKFNIENNSSLKKHNIYSSFIQNALKKTHQKEEKLKFLNQRKDKTIKMKDVNFSYQKLHSYKKKIQFLLLNFQNKLFTSKNQILSENWLNNLTNKSGYWWTQQWAIIDSNNKSGIFSFITNKVAGLFGFGLGQSPITLILPNLEDSQLQYKSKNSILFSQKREKKNILWVSTLFFHFCTILTILSISQIRDVLKFYFLGISKIYKLSLGLLAYSYNMPSRLMLIFNTIGLSSKKSLSIPYLNVQKTKQTILEMRRKKLAWQSIQFLPSKETILLNKSFFNKKRQGFSVKSTSTKRKGVFSGQELLPLLVFYQFLPFGLKAKGMGIEKPVSYPKTTSPHIKPINNLINLFRIDSLKQIEKNFILNIRLTTKDLFLLTNNANKKTSFMFLQKKVPLLSIILINSLLNNIYTFYKKGNLVLKKIIDLFGRFGPKSLLTILEKPGELIIDWIAYIFLVEWTSDLTNTIPENFDIYLGTSFYKMTRQIYSLNIYSLFSLQFELATKQFVSNGNNFIGLLQSKREVGPGFATPTQNVPNDIQNSFEPNFSFFQHLIQTESESEEKHDKIIQGISESNLKQKNILLENGLIVTLGTPFIQHRIYHLYELLLSQFYQPDTDLLIRQKKGILFWDLWGDFLMQVAAESNVNISELTSLKEEQIKLLEKTNELITRSSLKEKKFGIDGFITNRNKLSKNKVNFDKFNNFAAQQFLSYQGKDTELFIDLHPPKSFTMLSLIKQKESAAARQTSIGSLVCQILAGIIPKQISKNILIIGSTQTNVMSIKAEEATIFSSTYKIASSSNVPLEEKTLLVQAIAGETELKIITDNAYRYAMVYRGVAVGIKLLREVFDSLSLHTPCLFLIEDIHAIGERRPLLISDDEKGSSTNGKFLFGSQRDEIHEKNQVLYQLSKHVITHYRKPYKGDFSLLIPTNYFCFDLFKKRVSMVGITSLTSSKDVNSSKAKREFFSKTNDFSLSLNSPKITFSTKTKDSSFTTEKNTQKKKIQSISTLFSTFSSFSGGKYAFNVEKGKTFRLIGKPNYNSRLQIQSSQIFLPPSTSPFSVLNLKEERKFKPYRNVFETPWGGLVGEQLAQISKASYSIRVKVAMLADMAISTLSVKLDMITDLLVIIDSVKGNRGFVVFATTNVPQLLDPALRRPGRLDETITLGFFPNLLSRWSMVKTFSLFTYGKQHTGFGKGISIDLSNTINTPFVKLISAPKNKNPFLKNTSWLKTNEESLSLPLEINNKPIPISLCKATIGPLFTLKTKKKKKGVNKKIISSVTDLIKYQKFLFNSSQKKGEVFDLQKDSSIKTKRNFNNKKRFLNQILSQAYFISSNMLYESHLLNKKNGTGFKQNLIDYPTPPGGVFSLNIETSFLFVSLYTSTSIFKAQIVKYISSKLGEILLFSNTHGTQQNYKSQIISTKNSNTWKTISTLILSFAQKRYLFKTLSSNKSIFRQNSNLIIPKLLFFNNKISLYEAPSPPLSNVLLPARRYENYKRSFSFFSSLPSLSFSSGSNANYGETTIGIKDLISSHQHQRLIKKLYGFPVKNTFKSEIIENQYTSFSNANLMIGSFSSILQKPSSSSWFIKNRVFIRHKDYLTNQWWNGQLPEHNKETTFLSDIDWRYTFIDSIGDLLLDFPDSDQHYNPKNRRWFLTKGEFHNWFDFEKDMYNDVYTHFIFDSIIKAYSIFEKNREILDYYSFYNIKKGLYNNLNDFEILNLSKRFFF